MFCIVVLWSLSCAFAAKINWSKVTITYSLLGRQTDWKAENDYLNVRTSLHYLYFYSFVLVLDSYNCLRNGSDHLHTLNRTVRRHHGDNGKEPKAMQLNPCFVGSYFFTKECNILLIFILRKFLTTIICQSR